MADAVEIIIDLTANPAAAQTLTEAFKRVGAEGKKAADGINGEFNRIGASFKTLGAQLIGALGLAEIGIQFKQMVSEVLDNAEALHKLNQQTGITTTALQGLHEAARQNGVAQDAMDDSLKKLTVNLGKAADGALKPRLAITELGLSFADLRKLSPDQQMQAIIDKLGGVSDPARQARIGVALFGKTFQDIQPAIEAVAQHGLDPFLDKLKQLGVYLSGDQIAQMKALRDNMSDVGLQAKGVATQFLTGLVPAMQQGLGEILKATNGISSGFETVGSALGGFFKGLIFEVVAVGNAIGIAAAYMTEQFRIRWETTIKNVNTYFEGLRQNIDLMAHGHFVDAFKSSQATAAQIAKQSEDARKKLAALPGLIESVRQAWAQTASTLFLTPATTAAPQGPKLGDGGADLGTLKALAAARFQLLQTELANELALFDAQAKLKLTTEQAAYEQGKLSLKQYFADRASIINRQYDLEIEGLKAKIAATAALPLDASDPAASIQRQTQLLQLRGQLQQKEIERQTALAALTVQQEQAQRQLFADRMNAEARLALLQGKRFEAERDQLAVQLQALDLELRRAGVADREREAALALAKAQGLAKAGFDEQTQNADAALSSLNVGIAAIQNKIGNGQLFEIQGEQQIIALEKQRLPTLEKIGDAMLAFAEQSNKPQLIAQAQAFNQQLANIRTNADLAGRQMAAFKADVQDAFTNGLENFLASGINKVHSLGDAFRQLGLTIAQALQQAAAKQLANIFMQKLFDIIGKLSNTGTGGGDNSAKLEQASVKTIAGGASVSLGALLLGSSAEKLQSAADTLLLANVAGSFGGALAKGGVFQGGNVIPFATGGVVNAPTFFPMRNGVGLMGEKGPEGIVPLRRMYDGKLGVASAPGAAPNVQQSVRIVNVLDKSVVTAQFNGPEHEKSVLNIITRNQNLLKRTFSS